MRRQVDRALVGFRSTTRQCPKPRGSPIRRTCPGRVRCPSSDHPDRSWRRVYRSACRPASGDPTYRSKSPARRLRDKRILSLSKASSGRESTWKTRCVTPSRVQTEPVTLSRMDLGFPPCRAAVHSPILLTARFPSVVSAVQLFFAAIGGQVAATTLLRMDPPALAPCGLASVWLLRPPPPVCCAPLSEPFSVRSLSSHFRPVAARKLRAHLPDVISRRILRTPAWGLWANTNARLEPTLLR